MNHWPFRLLDRHALSLGNFIMYIDASIAITIMFFSAFLMIQLNLALNLKGVHFSTYVSFILLLFSNLLLLILSKSIIDRRFQVKRIA